MFNNIAEALPNIKFLWIGDGELRNCLTAPNIEITGWTDRFNALTLAQNADVFILTSLWEGLPISLLEAMFMKKTCVVSNVIGNKDVIHNKLNGYLCDNLDEFVKAIKDTQLSNENVYSEKAYQDIINTYNTKIQAKKYDDIYKQQLIKKHIN